ncbi:sulfatase-like hydrolase/transferase [Acidobacteria bacterium AH-259-O06]|nr:sulfatase-like hydrolase/transferase [Acidobacteria bacterium AH-259-O06]
MAKRKTDTSRKARPLKRRKRWLWLGGLLILAAVLATFIVRHERRPATSQIPEVSRPSVILITLDTLRRDYVASYGSKKVRTPHIDSLAADGVRFGTAVSEVPLTLPAHCALLTGTYPLTTGVHDNLGYTLTDEHLTLAEILREHGYRTAAFVGAYVLDSKWGLNQGFDHYDDDFPVKPDSEALAWAVERKGEDVSRPARKWIETQTERPLFCWIHLFDPHDPYDPPEPFRSQYSNDPYAGEVAYADHVVGEILQTLRERRLYDQSLVVLLGDHGEGLGEHRELTHGYFLYDSTLLVPFILKLPESQKLQDRVGSVIEDPVQLVDVAPTLLEILGIDRPTTFQGQSLSGVILGKSSLRERAAYSETYYPNEFGWSELKAWRTRDYKYILGPKPEIYDLRVDPAEIQNIVTENDSLANRFKSQLQRFEVRHKDEQAKERAQTQLSPEELERFRSLGYIGGSTRGLPSQQLSLPDPKDKIELFALISRAMTHIAQGQFQLALAVLKQLLQRDPTIATAYSLMGQCYLQTGKYRDAQASFKRVLQEQPDRVYPLFYLGLAHFQLKEYSRAEPLLQTVLGLDPKFFPAYNYLGLIYSDQGQSAQAIDAFSAAVKIRENASAYQMLGYLYTKENQPGKAARVFEKVVSLEPDNALAHLYLANAYQLQRRRDLAEQEYQKAFTLEPQLKEKIRTSP